jgi:transposase
MTSMVFCKPTAMLGFIISTIADTSSKQRVGRTYEESFSISSKRTNRPIASEAIQRIAALYAIEKEIRGRPPDERAEVRQSRARPLLNDMRIWLDRTLTTLSRKSDTAVAIRYALARWRALTRYVDDGAIEMDNNAAERALRAVCLGRKNYLFAGSDRGGERAAAFYSLIGTAKLNGVDPELYLHQLLERIGDHPINRISDLLPWNFAQDANQNTETTS